MPGHRLVPVRIVNAYIVRVLEAAPADARVSQAFQRDVHMIDSPAALFAPSLVWRVFPSPGRCEGEPAVAAAHGRAWHGQVIEAAVVADRVALECGSRYSSLRLRPLG